jgi:hypothetical protein
MEAASVSALSARQPACLYKRSAENQSGFFVFSFDIDRAPFGNANDRDGTR